jgi:hypothetical protein
LRCERGALAGGAEGGREAGPASRRVPPRRARSGLQGLHRPCGDSRGRVPAAARAAHIARSQGALWLKCSCSSDCTRGARARHERTRALQITTPGQSSNAAGPNGSPAAPPHVPGASRAAARCRPPADDRAPAASGCARRFNARASSSACPSSTRGCCCSGSAMALLWYTKTRGDWTTARDRRYSGFLCRPVVYVKLLG